MTDYESFKAMLVKSNIEFTEGHTPLAKNWKAINYKVDDGLAGSKEGFVTAFFNPDDKLDSFGFCD